MEYERILVEPQHGSVPQQSLVEQIEFPFRPGAEDNREPLTGMLGIRGPVQHKSRSLGVLPVQTRERDQVVGQTRTRIDQDVVETTTAPGGAFEEGVVESANQDLEEVLRERLLPWRPRRAGGRAALVFFQSGTQQFAGRPLAGASRVIVENPSTRKEIQTPGFFRDDDPGESAANLAEGAVPRSACSTGSS